MREMKFEFEAKITRCGQDNTKSKPRVVFSPLEKGKDLHVTMPEQLVIEFCNHIYKNVKITIEVIDESN